MRYYVIKFIIFAFVTTAVFVLAVVSLVAWILGGYLNDDWDWL